MTEWFRKNWIFVIMGCILVFWAITPVMAHDEDHDHDEWYKSLFQPDVPSASCCGLADAYWCDEYYAGKVGTDREGHAYCKITDDREDDHLGRMHIPVGTEIEIPTNKLNPKSSVGPGNPTGHNIIFLSRNMYVFCYVEGTGI